MKILFVAMHNSIHTARWINQLEGTGWDVHLFPVEPEIALPHFDLCNVTLYRPQEYESHKVQDSIKIVSFESLIFSERAKTSLTEFGLVSLAHILGLVIKQLKPHIVHSMEMQHAAYLTLEAKMILGEKFPPWIYSCWGSDIYYFQQFEEHRPRICDVLASCDYLFTDTYRDVDLAKRYGFKGELLGVYPGVGGYKIDEMRSLVSFIPPSQRKTIVIKGYVGWVYRPFVVLDALETCADFLRGYEIVIYQPCSDELVQRAHEICEKSGARLRLLSHRPHAEVVKLFGAARIALASSISDGTPNSMLEAMVMGAFPIQSDTVSTRDWVDDGVNGFLVAPEDVAGFSIAIKKALTNDLLVDMAAESNIEKLKNQIDYGVIQPEIITKYTEVISATPKMLSQFFCSAVINNQVRAQKLRNLEQIFQDLGQRYQSLAQQYQDLEQRNQSLVQQYNELKQTKAVKFAEAIAAYPLVRKFFLYIYRVTIKIHSSFKEK